MGSGASKSAAQSTIRKFPNRAPGSRVPTPSSSNASARIAAEQTTSRTRASRKASDQRAAAPASDFLFDGSGQEPAGKQGPAKASLSKDETIREDGCDPQTVSGDNMIQPDLAERLREIGIVQPNPTFSNSSTATTTTSHLHEGSNNGPIFPAASQNAVLSALEARRRVQEEADADFQSLGLSSGQGRRFLHAGMIRDILVMRERGASEAQIENRFNLRQGVMGRLGPRELYQPCVSGDPLPF